MAKSILDLIAENGEFVSFIRGIISTPSTATSILKTARNGGLSISTSSGLNIIQYLRDTLTPAQGYIGQLGLNKLPNVQRIPLSLTKQLRNFAYTVQFNGTSRITGETITNYITYSTNALLTKQQAIDSATQYAEGEGTSGNLEVDNASISNIYQNQAGLI